MTQRGDGRYKKEWINLFKLFISGFINPSLSLSVVELNSTLRICAKPLGLKKNIMEVAINTFGCEIRLLSLLGC